MPVVDGTYRAPNVQERAAITELAKAHAWVDTTEWTRDEKSVLLYIETQAVDNAGRLDPRKLNGEDKAIIRGWTEVGFLTNPSDPPGVDVGLSDVAWIAAHLLRRERADSVSKFSAVAAKGVRV